MTGDRRTGRGDRAGAERAERAAAERAPEPQAQAQLLALQAGAGNQAVAGLMRTPRAGAAPLRAPAARPAGRTLARFVGTEHKAIGDSIGQGVDLGNGVVLSWGDVIALAGDEYPTPEAMAEDVKTEAGKARLRAALEHDGIPSAIPGAHLPAPTPAQIKTQSDQFLKYAMTNVDHFPDGGAAVSAWLTYHAMALETAVQAGLDQRPEGMAAAYLNEAFGQHFLTDCFSGGHIRTPRTQIIDFYSTVFAPRVARPLIAAMHDRLLAALLAEASPQTAVPDFILEDLIDETLQPGIDAAVASAGGMDEVQKFIGLGVAGVVSGTLHDLEGATGVMVASDDHPEPWRAFGDAGLAKSPVSRQQAEAAIAAAKAQVDEAYVIGEGETADALDVMDGPPSRVHFAFNSSDLSFDAADAARSAAAFLRYRPDTVVEVVGHTDPIGSDDDNMALGQRRADAFVSALTAAGVTADRVHASSMGESALITADPKGYAQDRRADLAWASRPDPGGGGPPESDQDKARNAAMTKAQEAADPELVLRFVPRPVEERAQASVPDGNAALPEWHWGALDASFRGQIDDWIRSSVGTKLEDALDGVPQLDPVSRTVPVSGTVVTVHPRDRAKEIVRALMANPTATIGDLGGWAPGP